MTTTWQIAQLKRTPDTELVFEVVYIMNFQHEGESDRLVGVKTLTGDPADPAFIPFANLTEAIVLDWIKDDLGQERIDEIEASFLTKLEAAVERRNNPEFLTGTPW